jgi:hypothetical protein
MAHEIEWILQGCVEGKHPEKVSRCNGLPSCERAPGSHVSTYPPIDTLLNVAKANQIAQIWEETYTKTHSTMTTERHDACNAGSIEPHTSGHDAHGHRLRPHAAEVRNSKRGSCH